MAGNSGVSAVVVQPFGAPVAGPFWWNPNEDIICPNIWPYRAINTPGTPWPGGPVVYADTLVNLVNPGTNDLVEGNGVVPWNGLLGWGFVAAIRKYFNTFLSPPAGVQSVWTMIIRFTGGSPASAVFFLAHVGATRSVGFGLANNIVTFNARFINGGAIAPIPVPLAGSMAVAGNAAYRNGLPVGGPIAPNAVNGNPIFIGVSNRGFPFDYATADMESVWIGDCTLPPAQVLAVDTAMSQL